MGCLQSLFFWRAVSRHAPAEKLVARRLGERAESRLATDRAAPDRHARLSRRGRRAYLGDDASQPVALAGAIDGDFKTSVARGPGSGRRAKGRGDEASEHDGCDTQFE